jgi:hypothetical protein
LPGSTIKGAELGPRTLRSHHGDQLIAIAASIAVARWRMTLRVILIIVIALAVYGAIVGFEGLNSMMNPVHSQSQIRSADHNAT